MSDIKRMDRPPLKVNKVENRDTRKIANEGHLAAIDFWSSCRISVAKIVLGWIEPQSTTGNRPRLET
ncbi:hypothetical protein MESS4_710100 [Mesorhizobium sp. STM 4661]|nr:hypothetical protein MESS4_710100 [Mesorhizobium sp. STM 4661]